jgi:hypothetical protein
MAARSRMMTKVLGVVDGAAQPPGMTCSHRITLATSCMSVSRRRPTVVAVSLTGDPRPANRRSPPPRIELAPSPVPSLVRGTRRPHGQPRIVTDTTQGSSRAVLRARQTGVMSLTTTRSLSSCRAAFAACQRSGWSPRTGLPLHPRLEPTAPRSTKSSSPAVPLACHSQKPGPVPSGQPRTTPKRPQPAPFAAIAGSDPAPTGLGAGGRTSGRSAIWFRLEAELDACAPKEPALIRTI